MLWQSTRGHLACLLLISSLMPLSSSYAESSNGSLASGYEALAAENYEQSFEIFSALVNQGSTEAHFSLALFYKNGWGQVESNPKRACELFSYAAKNGIPVAQQEYGYCIVHNHGVDISDKPQEWFKKAYNDGVYEAACDIGRLYLGTQWQQRNLPLAINWCKQAAQRSALKAQVTLGDIYANYSEVFNIEQAEFWYTQAINNDSGEAAYKLAKIYLRLIGQQQGGEDTANRALFLMELASSRFMEKAYEPTAKMYWKKLQSSATDGSALLAKSYLWAKAAHHVNPTAQATQFLAEVERELPTQWKTKLDSQVEEFIESKVR